MLSCVAFAQLVGGFTACCTLCSYHTDTSTVLRSSTCEISRKLVLPGSVTCASSRTNKGPGHEKTPFRRTWSSYGPRSTVPIRALVLPCFFSAQPLFKDFRTSRFSRPVFETNQKPLLSSAAPTSCGLSEVKTIRNSSATYTTRELHRLVDYMQRSFAYLDPCRASKYFSLH